MSTTKLNAKGLENMARYVANRAKGQSKGKSAINAGYSPNTTPQLIEKRKNYAIIVDKILNETSTLMYKMISSVHGDFDAGKLDAIDPERKVRMLKDLSQLEKNITPQVTIKETMDENGVQKRTMWATMSATTNQEAKDPL